MSPKASGVKVVATNRRARRDYEILDSWECGLMLQGSEVKSLRESKVQLADSYARLQGDDVWLVALHIAPYSAASTQGGHEASRDRKLLLHRSEIEEMRAKVDQERLTLVPLSLYFKDGRAKLELGLGRGRRQYDKRQAIAKRDAELEARRATSRGGRHD